MDTLSTLERFRLKTQFLFDTFSRPRPHFNPAFSITENGAIRKRSTEWTLSKETDFEDDLNVFDRKTPFFKKANGLVWTRRKVACRASTQLVSFLHRTKYVSSLHSQTIFIN